MRARPGLRAAFREFAALVLGFGAMSCAANWPLPLVAGWAMHRPFDDPGLNAWILAWGAERLLAGGRGLWTAPIFHPLPDTLAYSEHLIGITIFIAPLYRITGSPTLVYNAAQLLAPVLAALGMFHLARALTGRADAALVAATAFAFAPIRLAHLIHLQVLAYGWMPFALLGLHRYLQEGSRRHLALFTAAFLLQSLSNGYFLYFLAIPAAMLSLHGLWVARAAWRRRVIGLSAAAAVILAAMAPVIAAYSRVRYGQGLHRWRADLLMYSAEPGSYLRVVDLAALWRGILPIGPHELALFPGALATIFAALGAAWAFSRGAARRDGRRTVVALYAAITLVACVLSLGPAPRVWQGLRLPTAPYAWLTALLPGMDGLRAPARMGVVVLMGICVLAAFGLAALLARATPRTRRPIAALGVAMAFAEGFGGRLAVTAMPGADMIRERPAYEWVASRGPGAVLELPAGDTPHEIRYTWQTLRHHRRTVNGYSGYGSPLREVVNGPAFRELENIDVGIETMQVLGVRYIVIHDDLYDDREFGGRLRSAIEAAVTRAVECRTFERTHVCELAASGGPAPLSRDPPLDGRVPGTEMTITASHGQDQLAALVDRDGESRWTTGAPQQGGEWLQVVLERPRALTHARLEMRLRSMEDYPRRLEIETSADGRTFESVFRGAALPSIALSLVSRRRDPGIDIPLGGRLVSVVRIGQTGRTPHASPWAVHEIRLWGR